MDRGALAYFVGSLFGRGSLRRATSAARGAGWRVRETDDVERAARHPVARKDARAAFEQDIEEAFLAQRTGQERRAPTIELATVRPAVRPFGDGPQAGVEACVMVSNASRTSAGASTSSISTPSPPMGAASLPLGWMKHTR